MGEGGPAAELHVAVQPGLPAARQGAGAVHHVAFRAPDEAVLHEWTERLQSFRLPSSGEVERFYFRSLYFREPNGILFEIATDGPGFAVDEPMETLGEGLSLPPFLEHKRSADRGTAEAFGLVNGKAGELPPGFFHLYFCVFLHHPSGKAKDGAAW